MLNIHWGAAQVPAGPAGAPVSLSKPGPPAAPPRPTQDLRDVVGQVFPRFRAAISDSAAERQANGRSILWLPIISYTPETRFLASITANKTLRQPGATLSVFTGQASYTLNQQLILTLRGGLWTKDNRSFWQNDYRYLHYPQPTYGLGTGSRPSDKLDMDYRMLRLQQNYYHHIGHGRLYLGMGYHLNARWNIETRSASGEMLSAVDGYSAGVRGSSVSSAVALSALRDTRANPLRPAAGESYLLALARFNRRGLGASANWQSYILDLRRYQPLGKPGNVLALWSYTEIVQGGTDVPFLDLPATGWDPTNTTGRGYIQGRFRGTSMFYAEAEYRFNLSRSRFFGGTVFANAQTLRNPVTGFGRLAPAAGAGVRFCLSKRSNTYLAFDYAFGLDGSRGLWFNLGEVF